MRVRVLYFAVVRERLGRGEELFDLGDGSDLGASGKGPTLAGLLDAICERHPAVRALRPHLQVALNQAFCPPSTTIRDGDEVALIPPVSGGSSTSPAPAIFVGIRKTPLLLDEVVRAVEHAGAGGVACFAGNVRGHSRGKTVLRLEYEAYEPMAEAALRAIVEALYEEHGARVAILHRVGVLGVGECAVVIAAAAAHRAEAFAACQGAIERLKASAPIWKKEFYDDGAEWVGLGP